MSITMDNVPMSKVMIIKIFIHLRRRMDEQSENFSPGAAIIKYRRVGGLNSRGMFLQVLRLEV